MNLIEAFTNYTSKFDSDQSTITAKDQLRDYLIDIVDALIDSGENNIKRYEAALQDGIEQFYPDTSWWDITDCNIFMSLFEGRDPYNTVEEIVDGIKIDLGEAINTDVDLYEFYDDDYRYVYTVTLDDGSTKDFDDSYEAIEYAENNNAKTVVVYYYDRYDNGEVSSTSEYSENVWTREDGILDPDLVDIFRDDFYRENR